MSITFGFPEEDVPRERPDDKVLEFRPRSKFAEDNVSDVIPTSHPDEIWVADLIHGLWIKNGTRSLTLEEINKVMGVRMQLDVAYKIMGSESFYARMHARGINWISNWTPERHELMRSMERLTPQQVYALQIMLDPTDRRSTNAKLRHVGITYAQWRNWLREPFFGDMVKDTAEQMLTDNIANVHTRLAQKADAGDVQAMKLFYEVSGRHDPNRQQMLDFTKILGLFLEVIQRHITEPKTFLAISNDLDDVMAGKELKPLDRLPANIDPDIVDADVLPDDFFEFKDKENG